MSASAGCMGKKATKGEPSSESSEDDSAGAGGERSARVRAEVARQLAQLAERAAVRAEGLADETPAAGWREENRRARRAKARGSGETHGGGGGQPSRGGKPVPQIYAVVCSSVAPQGIYLSKTRLENAFKPGVGWGHLSGAAGDLKGYQLAELSEAVEYFFARHPQCGKVEVFR